MDDELKLLRENIKELTTAFNTFRLTASMDIVEIKTKTKLAGVVAGLIFGTTSSILITLLKGFF